MQPLFSHYPQVCYPHNRQTLSMSHPSQINSNMVKDVHDPGILQRQIFHLPDPEHLYNSLFMDENVQNRTINCPNIHDEDSHLIMPGVFLKKLKDGLVVINNVTPSL
jgi:hypothetical protein